MINYTEHQRRYIESVDGDAPQSAVKIIRELEAKNQKQGEQIEQLKADFRRIESAVDRGDIMALSDIVEQALAAQPQKGEE